MTNVDLANCATYEAGELVVVRGNDAVAMIDDRDGSPDASFGIIAAVSGGDVTQLRAAVRQAADAVRGVAVAWSEAGRCYIAHAGSLVVAVETRNAMSTIVAKPAQVNELCLAEDSHTVKMHSVDFSGASGAARTSLDAGATRGDLLALSFADSHGAALSAAVVESAPVRIAATVQPAADTAAPAAAPPLPPPIPATDPAAAPAETRPPIPEPEPAAAQASPPAPIPPVPPAETPPPAPVEAVETDASSTAQFQLVHLGEDPPSPDPLPVDDAAVSSEREVTEVLGIRCPADHHNHPDALYCSQCGRRMGVNQTAIARPGPRPPLGLFLIDDVATFPIAEDFIIGRAPDSHADVAAGTQSLTIDDDARAISRAHTAVHLDGWDVTVIDLNSANGTFLRRAGQSEWEAVASTQPSTMFAGDVLKIGERELQLELHHVQT